MYNINYKKIVKDSINSGETKILFLIFGFIFIGILWYVLVYLNIKDLDKHVISSNMQYTTSNDSDGDLIYKPVYQFKINDIVYRCSSIETSKEPKKELKIYYNSSDPNNCMTSSDVTNQYYALLGVSYIPLIFIIIAVYDFYKLGKKIKKIKSLEASGQLVKNVPFAMIENKDGTYSISVDYKTPDGKIIPLVGSKKYSQKYAFKFGEADVLIDPYDLTNYYVDFNVEFQNSIDK